MKHAILPVLLIMLLTQGFLSCKKLSKDKGDLFGRDASYAFGVYIGSDLAVKGKFNEMDAIVQGMKDVISGGKTLFTLEEAETMVNNIDSFGENFYPKEMSYAFGMGMGSYLTGKGINPDINEVSNGLKNSFSGSKTRFNLEEARAILGESLYKVTENKKNEDQRKEKEFFAEVQKKPGIIVTASGLMYEIINEGNGTQPVLDDKVKVNYKVWLPDGTISERSQGEPAVFTVDMLLPGWVEAIQLMREGGKYIFYIPSELSVCPEDVESTITYTTPVTFEVELLEIVK